MSIWMQDMRKKLQTPSIMPITHMIKDIRYEIFCPPDNCCRAYALSL